ncbi:MAG: hypothetical protein WCC10_04570 [Tumebacillaceae bacterium]
MRHLSENDIWCFLEGKLPDDEWERVEEHLAECDVCCDMLANLAELGAEIPELFPLEEPSAGFADRVMDSIAREAGTIETQDLPDNVIPLHPRRKSPRYEAFTRFVTAAVVTGFMVLGSAQFDSIPVVGSIGQTVSETGIVVSDGTYKAYSQLSQWIHHLNATFSE